MTASKAIEVSALSKSFGSKVVLSDVTFTVPQGSIVGFLGPNGAGKTTTIRCLMDFIRPTSGTITIFGKNAQHKSTELKKDIGFLAADAHLNDKWTVKEHLNLAEKIRAKSRPGKHISELFELDMHEKVKNLSTGNKQKLAIALALVGQPKLLIMDEPTRGLDPVLQNILYKLLKDFVSDGNTIFFSSHNLTEVQHICDGVVIIKNGKIVTEQGIDEIRGANIHIIHATTRQMLDKKVVLPLNTEILYLDPHHISLKVKGDITHVISYLLKAGLIDLSVNHASLEDIFLEKYKEKA